MMTFPKQQHTTLFIFYTLLYIISYINTPSPAPGGGIPPYQATHVKMTRESKDEAVKTASGIGRHEKKNYNI